MVLNLHLTFLNYYLINQEISKSMLFLTLKLKLCDLNLHNKCSLISKYLCKYYTKLHCLWIHIMNNFLSNDLQKQQYYNILLQHHLLLQKERQNMFKIFYHSNPLIILIIIMFQILIQYLLPKNGSFRNLVDNQLNVL